MKQIIKGGLSMNIHKLIKSVLLVGLMAIMSDLCRASVVIYGKAGRKILVGKNVDQANLDGRIWFVPSGTDTFGAVYIGQAEDDPRSGFNSQGLFATIVDCPYWQVNTDPDREVLFGNLVEQIMETCANVDDVMNLWKNNNIYDLHYAQIMVADKSGQALIIESNTTVEPVKGILAMSNFYQTNTELGTQGQDRVRQAKQIITDNGINFDSFRQALSIIRHETDQPTIYSYLYDLKKGKLHLYNFHDFETVVVLNIEEELSKSKHSLSIQEVFGKRLPYKIAYEKYLREQDIRFNLRIGDFRIAAEKIKKWFFENSGFDMYSENGLNALGYQLMAPGQLNGAITIFELNVELHPEAFNPWDSLGEAYMNANRTVEAIKSYRKSLEFNPDNTNAVEMIRRMENGE